ncbi:MAG: hypothetical protein ACOH1N_14170 [Lutibacter sp.]
MAKSELKYLESFYFGSKVWKLYRNSQGYIEGYRSSRISGKSVNGNIIAEQLDRIITNTKDVTEFIKFVRQSPTKIKYHPEDDPNQLKIM